MSEIESQVLDDDRPVLVPADACEFVFRESECLVLILFQLGEGRLCDARRCLLFLLLCLLLGFVSLLSLKLGGQAHLSLIV